MSSLDQQRAFLDDVDAAAQWHLNSSGSAPISLPAPLWEDVQNLAQEAAEFLHPDGMCPVWASDAELTATHLARRKSTMDQSEYRSIVHDIGKQYITACAAEDGGELWSDDDPTLDYSMMSEESDASAVFEEGPLEPLSAVFEGDEPAFNLATSMKARGTGMLQPPVVDDMALLLSAPAHPVFR